MTKRSPIPAVLAGVLNEGTPVTPRSAATVLLLDGSTRPWRVLMMRRPGGADFAPGAFVFPGGSVHPEDAALGDEARAAATRELFEEMGILLARRGDGRFARDPDCRKLRALLNGGRSWMEALAVSGLTLALDRLTFLARWITPEVISRRFDTRFYLARRPAGQTIHPQPGEVAEWCWTTAAQAVAADGVALVYATRRILETVAGESDATRLIASLRRRPETPPVIPRVVRRPDGGLEVVDDAGT